MSIIDKSNIEHWLFQYYEGALSYKDKATLFDFLDHHSEFHEEFTLWAGTKLSPDPNLMDLDLENSLFRPVPQLSSSNTWLSSTVLAGACMALSLVMLCRGDQCKTSSANSYVLRTSTKDTVSFKPHMPKLKRADMVLVPKKVNAKTLQEAEKTLDTLQNQTVLTPEPNVSNSQSTLLSTTEQVAAPDSTSTSAKPGTIQGTASPVEMEIPKQTVQKKKKKKANIDFTPSDDFIKDNSDF